MITFSILTIIMLIGLSGLMAATETAITASSPGKIQKLKSEGDKRAGLLLKILKTKDKVISTLLIGNSILNTICTTIAAGLFIEFLGDDLGTVIASAVMSVVIIVFAEVVPKAIAVVKSEQLALFMASPIRIFLKILKPINYFLAIVVKLFCLIFRINLKQQISGTDEVRGVIEHHLQEGNVYKSDRDMLEGVLDIRDMTVSEIMVHRSNIVSINADLPNEEIVKNILSSIHTRIPLWKDNKDNIVGILHSKDLLRRLHETNDTAKPDIRSLMTEPWFVPDNALVIQQLHDFKERKTHFACVVDEYGDLQGIITLEDILEEIVGQIYDEHDRSNETIIKKSDTEFIIDGSVTIRDINREMNWDLPDEDANTIAGLIIHEMERIPKQGEILEKFNLKITVLKKFKNRIKTIKVSIIDSTDTISD